MSHWWKSERSLLAARVRSTRKRLRDSYRETLHRETEAEIKRLREHAQKTERTRDEKLALAEAECRRLVDCIAAARLLVREHGLVKEIVVSVTFDTLALKIVDPAGMRVVLAEKIGAAAAEAVQMYGREPRRG